MVELVFALMVAATVVWFVQQAWVPVIDKTIKQMPPTGEIRGGRLDWPSGTVLQQEGPFMRIAVRPGGFTNVEESADLVLAFGSSDLRIGSSLGLGLLTLPYPMGWILSFNKTELEPWWGARSHMVLAGLAYWLFWRCNSFGPRWVCCTCFPLRFSLSVEWTGLAP